MRTRPSRPSTTGSWSTDPVPLFSRPPGRLSARSKAYAFLSFAIICVVTALSVLPSLAPDPSWVWIAPAILFAPVLELVLERSATGRWHRLVPVLLAVAFSLALYVVPPIGREGVGFLMLALIAGLAVLAVLPAFSYALDHMSKAWAVLIASVVSFTILFLFVPDPLTGLGRLVAGYLGLQGPAVWPVAGLALFVYGLLTGGMGYAFALFVDEVSDRMSSLFSGLVFGAILLLAGLGIGEAVAGGLLAFALLQYLRLAPEKGVHMLVLFPVVVGVLAVTAFAQAHPGVVGSEAFVLPLLVPAVAVITPFIMLEPQVLTQREGIATVLAVLVALPVISLIATRSPTVAGLNIFRPGFALPLAFEQAIMAWLLLYLEVLLIALAFYLIVVMGFSALRRAKVQA